MKMEREESQEIEMRWLLFTVMMGGIAAAIYSFLLKKKKKEIYSTPASASDTTTTIRRRINWCIFFFTFLKSFLQPNTCCSHSHSSSTSGCIDLQFSSWEERIIRAKKRERKVGFYLKKKASGEYVLAVVGKQSIISHTSYQVCRSFARIYSPHLSNRQGLKWNTKHEVMDWLSTLITQQQQQQEEEEAPSNNMSRDKTEEGNSFFKVLIGEFQEQLNIPSSTYLQQQQCNHMRDGWMRLRNGEREWKVEVGGRTIKSGWHDFVKDHKLREGDFLMFTALGEMFYNVAIFGEDGRIKEFPWFHAFNPDDRVVYVS